MPQVAYVEFTYLKKQTTKKKTPNVMNVFPLNPPINCLAIYRQ